MRVSRLRFRFAFRPGGLRGTGRPVRRRRAEDAELLVSGGERGGSELRAQQRVERRGAVREALAAALLERHVQATRTQPTSRRAALQRLSRRLVCEKL